MKKPQSVSCIVRGIHRNLTHFMLFRFTLCDKCCLACKIRGCCLARQKGKKKKERKREIETLCHPLTSKCTQFPHKGYIFRAQHAEMTATTGGAHSMTYHLRPCHPSYFTSLLSCYPSEASFTHCHIWIPSQSCVSSFFFLTQPCCFTPITLLYSPLFHAVLQL